MALGLPMAVLPCVNLMDLPGPLKIIAIRCVHRAHVITRCREVTTQRQHNISIIHDSRLKLQDKVLKSWEKGEFYQYSSYVIYEPGFNYAS